ncbi:hypothetical protein [Thalassospira lucentensis]|uniref:hypothetical protein n=1 Tax=Thalassospira lucentensis TaxID=168935 RepID=UPI003D295565|tara:strand:- start:104 stop:925 length:822 start_codon:yes stop_codon:yes gene_type:complete
MRRLLPSKRKVTLAACTFVAIGFVTYGALTVKDWYDADEAEKYAELSRPLVQALAKELDVPYVDAARVFVFRNTDHDMESDWYKAHAEDLPYVLEHLYKTAISASDAERPDLACGWRVKAMKSLLAADGISADTVYLYNDTGADPNQNSHVVIEASNPETGRLEVHDVDFNVKYLRSDGATASLSDLMKSTVPSDFRTCDESGCLTDRVLKTTVGKNDFYKGVYYRDRDVFLLSRSKFDIEKTFTIHRIRGDEVMDVYDYFNYIYPNAPIVEF